MGCFPKHVYFFITVDNGADVECMQVCIMTAEMAPGEYTNVAKVVYRLKIKKFM